MDDVCSGTLIEKLDCCPACGGREYRELTSPEIAIGREFFSDVLGRLLLVRCLRCSHVYQKTRPSEELLDLFYRTSSEYAPFGHGRDAIGAIADRLRLMFIDRFLPVGGLLDFGGGGGRFASSAKGAGRDAAVVELSPIGREQCQGAGISAYANIADVPAAEQFEIISMIHVLEHVGDPIDTLRHVSEALPPRGGIYIEVPNLRSLRARVFPLIARRCPHDCWFRAFPSHLHGFDRKSLSEALRRAGLRAMGWTTYGGGFEIEHTQSYAPAQASRSAGASATDMRDVRAPFRERLKLLVKRVLFDRLLLGENLCVFCDKLSESGREGEAV